MSWIFFIVLFAVLIRSGFGLVCTQIPSTSIFAGSTVHLPGPSDQLQIIPANFNCLYKISATANSTHGVSAKVVIRNGMKGVNDYIRVVDMNGSPYVLNSRTDLSETFSVIPGAEMTIQVVTKSVYMMSMLEIIVEYSSAQIGPTFPIKTGAEMNYIDVTSLRDGKSLFNSVTFVGTEPIYMTFASHEHSFNGCWDCFVIDGTIKNQTQIHRMIDLNFNPFTTKSNAITILSSSDNFLGLVFNPKSEADNMNSLLSESVDDSPLGYAGGSLNEKSPSAIQVVNFETNGIIMESTQIFSRNCIAYVVHGPPNNSSKVLLDLSTNPVMPHSFDVKYLSVVAVDCDLVFDVKGYRN